MLVFFVYPLWDVFKKYDLFVIAIGGINAVACGFIASICVLLTANTIVSIWDFLIALASFVCLYSGKVNATVIVVVVIILGFIF